MARVRLKGINRVNKTLANGSRVTYFYHRSSGTRLPDNPSDPNFAVAYAEAETIQPRDTGTVAGLIRLYLLSVKFDRRADSTKREYRRILTKLETRFGTMPIKALTSPKVRGAFLSYQEEIGRDHPREADNRLTILSTVFSYAFNRGEIADNPLRGFERLWSNDRSEFIWTEHDLSKFMEEAPLELQQALILAIHTGQRYGDLIRLRWSDYDGENIALKQRKTKKPVFVPSTVALKRMLDGMERCGPFILTRPDGRPWFTEKNDKALSKAWREHSCAANIVNLRFNDLRGTAVTLMTEAGVSIPQAAAITGHTLQSASRILERYGARTRALAKAAIVKFEAAPEASFANRLQTKPAHHKKS